MKKYASEENLSQILTESKSYTDAETTKIQTDLNKFKIESWIFTLNDGTTITKQMVVK